MTINNNGTFDDHHQHHHHNDIIMKRHAFKWIFLVLLIFEIHNTSDLLQHLMKQYDENQASETILIGQVGTKQTKKQPETTSHQNFDSQIQQQQTQIILSSSNSSRMNILSDFPIIPTTTTTKDHKNIPTTPITTTLKDKNEINNIPKPIWESSKILPRWMKNYFQWHQQQLSFLNESNWNSNNYRYLVMRCLKIDNMCGGASDRLQSIPYAIYLAAQSNRILFIKWERPAPLQEFLVPPTAKIAPKNDKNNNNTSTIVIGMDWRIPGWLDPKFNYGKRPNMWDARHAARVYDNATLVHVRDQGFDHGAKYYNRHQPRGDPTFEEIFHDCWNVLFQPSLPVKSLIAHYQNELGLSNINNDDDNHHNHNHNPYVSLHIRSLYKEAQVGNYSMIENALNCAVRQLDHQERNSASSLSSKTKTIFVASDSWNVSKAVIEYTNSKLLNNNHPSTIRVVARLSGGEPLHLDRGTSFLTNQGANWRQFSPQDYYNTFVDLYLLSGGNCIILNEGGYGKWANLLSSNQSCMIDHGHQQCSNPVLK